MKTFLKIKEKKNVLYLSIIAILTGVIFYQAYLLKDRSYHGYSYFEKGEQKDDFFNGIESYLKNRRDFNFQGRFFNDNFWEEPDHFFEKFEKMQNEMFDSFGFDKRGLLSDKDWGGLFDKESDLGNIKKRTEETDDKIILLFEIPGLKNKTLKIDVNENHVSMEYDVTLTKEDKNEHGEVIRRSTSRKHESRQFALPPNVESDKAYVDIEGEKVKIELPKKGVS